MRNVLQIVNSVTCRGGGAYLPNEIVTEILIRLPPKFLGRCKCVSKEWNTLISDPEFIKTNFSLNTRRQKKAIYLGAGARWQRPLAIFDADSGRVSFPKQKIKENPLASLWLMLIFGSYNGLVLALDTEHVLLLLNPTTRAYKIVPTPPQIDPTLDWVIPKKRPILGLGYDSVTNNYTVITITPRQTVFVYTFKSGSWKRVQDCPFAYVNRVASSVFLNASIHWLHGGDYSSVWFITAFDLTNEKFREVPLPRALRILHTSYLDVVGGCLCVLINNVGCSGPAAGFDLWVMKEYGIEESWTKFSINYTLPLVQPQEGFVGDHLEQLVLIGKRKHKVWFYYANKGKWRGVPFGVRSLPIDGCKFADRLISP